MPDKKKIIASDNIPQAPNIEGVVEKRVTVIPSDNIPQAPNIESITEEIRAKISTEIPISDVNDPELKSLFVPFDGKWMPDNEPIEIGSKNFKTLQNFRYAGDEIIHLEGVKGYSKINTDSLSGHSYENIRNGCQLRSEHTKKTYVLVHTEHDTPANNESRIYQNQTSIPDQGNFYTTITATTIAFVDSDPDTITDSGNGFVTAGFKSGMSIDVKTGSTTNDGTYTIYSVVAGTITLTSFDSLTAEAAVDAGSVSIGVFLHEDSECSLEGRFSDAPTGQIAYCNGKESCIWAGEEMRCAGFFTLFAAKIVGSSDISFVDGGAGADTITDAGNGFVTAGFKAGHLITVSETGLIPSATFSGAGLNDLTSGGTYSGKSIKRFVVKIDNAAADPDTFKWSNDNGTTWQATGVDITGAAQTLEDGVTVTFGAVNGHTDDEYWTFKVPGNDGEYHAVSVVAGTITLPTGVLSGNENNTSAIITVSVRRYYTEATDYTDRANNEIETENQIISLSGANGYRWVVFSTRPLEAVNYKLKSVNATTATITASTIAFVDSNPDTITDSGNGFVTGGFVDGMVISVSGSTDNDSYYTIDSVVAGTITLIPSDAVTVEGASAEITITGPMTTCKTWDGKNFISVTNLSDGTNTAGSMRQDGQFSFASTTGIAKPLHFEGLYLYAYLFELSGGSVEIYNVTVKAPFQNIVDVWDGVYREPIKFQLSRGLSLGSANNGVGVVTTTSLAGYPEQYVAEISDATDYSNIIVGTEITANALTRVVTEKIYEEGLTTTSNDTTIYSDFKEVIVSLAYFEYYGFKVGDNVAISGTVNNDGNYTIAGIYSWGFSTEESLTNETVVTDVTITRSIQRYVVFGSAVDWYNSGDGYSFTYKMPEDPGTADYEDFTLEIIEPSYADYPIGAVIDAFDSSNHILIAFEERMSAMLFTMIADLVNHNNSLMTINYWNGTQYVSVSSQLDATQGLPGGSMDVGRSFNRTGMVSWEPPDEKDEFRQTVFGITAYYYEITVDATIAGTEGDPAEIVIDTVKGVPAQKTVNPFKFPAQYKNRALLCGFTEGKEGNRVDYSVTDAPDVFNGDESSMDSIQSLYVGGGNDLNCGIELFNRFGSNIISSFLFFKNNETYILTGDGPDNYKLYKISGIIGCPAPLTLDTAETGYTFAEEINRNIVIWMSYSGPMIFDGAAIVPIRGIEKYFDPAKSTCVKYSIIERCRGRYDATHKEYNLWIPSGSSATECNVWLVYDLVRKRWFEKIVGASEIPQCAFPVLDTDGVQYIYTGIDDGHLMRLENGNTWADDDASPIIGVIETGDFFPSADVWEKTRLRRFKMAVKTISEASKDIAIKHYTDTATLATIIEGTIAFNDNGANADTITDSGSGFVTAGFAADQTIHVTTKSGTNDGTYTIATVVAGTITLIDIDALTTETAATAGTVMIDSYSNILTALNADSGSGDVTRENQGCNLLAWCHRFRFTIFTAATSQLHPILWGVQFYVEREDID